MRLACDRPSSPLGAFRWYLPKTSRFDKGWASGTGAEPPLETSLSGSVLSAGFLRPSRKLPGFRRYFYFFTLLDEERNPDLKPRLQFGHLGATSARRIATYGRFRFGNLQLDKHRQLQTNRVAVVLVVVEHCTLHQKVQRVADNLSGKAQSLEVFLVQEI